MVDRPSMLVLLGRGPATGPGPAGLWGPRVPEAGPPGDDRLQAQGRGTGGVIGLRERDGAPRNRSIRPLVPYTTGTQGAPPISQYTFYEEIRFTVMNKKAQVIPKYHRFSSPAIPRFGCSLLLCVSFHC